MKYKKHIRISIGSALIAIGVFMIVDSRIISKKEYILEENKIEQQISEHQELEATEEYVSFEKEDTNSYIKTIWIIGSESYGMRSLPNQTVYDVMLLAREQNIFSFEGKQYPMLGFFVTRIGELEMIRGTNLMYYINDVEAPTGVSTYILKDEDIIEWKLN